MTAKVSDSKYRRFLPELEQLASQWNCTAETSDHWTDLELADSTESKPRKVQNQDGLLGVAKPGIKRPDGVARAAHEKITSDLAYHLGLPVPPVILWDRGTNIDDTAERYTGISAWAFPQPLSWDKAVKQLSENMQNSASASLSAMYTFETWITATDRKPAHILVYLEDEDESVRLAFIDYAYSMTYQWKSENAPAGTSQWCLELPKDTGAIQEIVDKIEALDDEVISTIVSRVPETYLTPSQSNLIIQNLGCRRHKIESIINSK